MKYKILIKKCEDPQRASGIAAEVARWSGSTPDVVYNAITQKAICIRKEADEDEAQRLSAQFGAIGAEVELVPLQEAAPVAAAAAFAAAPAGYAAAAPMAAAVPPTSTAARHDDDDEEEEEPGRILTDEEYAAAAKSRPDVFHFEKSGRMRNIQIICMVVAVAAIFAISAHVPVEVATDFFEKMPEERSAKLVKADEIQAQLDEQKKKEEEQKKEKVESDKKQLKPTKSQGVSASTGGGDPRARVTQMGVLGIVSGQIKGKSVASADIFGKGGFASDIDAILSGVGGLKSGGDGGVGRKGVAGIGYGSGYGSGFGGSGGGIDDLMSSLSGGGGSLDLKKRGELKVSSPDFLKGGALTGGRSRASIQRVVMQNMAALRHAYSRRLKDKPGLSGTVTVKFSIDEFGKVIYASMVSSTLSDSELETTVVSRVRSWMFDKIDKPGDVTEVTYPFTFTQ
ncbi:MAG: TonB family protein [Chitinispirillia bacterium]|nr:TonB family protein [Chitinispirillia bacterium]MCL2241834.1 TonB family protein [Chitinispirillia bacterium]